MAVRFEVEAVVPIKERGVHVLAKSLVDGIDFHIPRGSTLGGVELENFLDVPRAADAHGNQRTDLFAFKLKEGATGEQFVKGAVVELRPGDQLEFHPPWHSRDVDLVKQYDREAHSEHVLFGRTMKTIARRQDNDDVLFELLDEPRGFAVVHLTWAQKKLSSAQYPHTRLFSNWWEVFEQVILADNANWN